MRGLLLFLVIAAITFITIAAYYPTLNGGYFADDYALQISGQELNVRHLFSPANGYSCRPLEVLFLYTMQRCFGCENTLPIHLVNLFIHCTFSMLIMVYMFRNRFSPVSSIIAFAYMILSQANSHAVASIDTFSQLTSTFLSYASIVLYYNFLKNKRSHLLIISIGLYIAGLYCKETSLFVLPFIFLLSLNLWIGNERKFWTAEIGQCLSIIPYIAVTGAYFWFREFLGLTGASAGDDRYNICFGFNIVKNFVMLLFQSLQPHSSVNLYFDIVNSKWMSIVLVISTSCVFCCLAGWGIVKSGSLIKPLLLLPASIFPVILLLQRYNRFPFFVNLICRTISGSCPLIMPQFHFLKNCFERLFFLW